MEYYNLIGYLIYLPLTFYITVIVGRSLYNNGCPYLIESFGGDRELATILNRFLLTGYYLINLGYAAVSIAAWDHIGSLMQLAEELNKRVGLIMISLAIIHYGNLFTFSHFSKQIQQFYHKHH